MIFANKFFSLTVDVYYWVKDWQTLIAGIIALLAALWTIEQIKKQITQQRASFLEDKRRYDKAQKRKELAAKANLPFCLSEICEYAKQCAHYFSDELFVLNGQDRLLSPPLILPPATSEMTLEIRKSIEFVDSVLAQRLYELLVFYQIHSVRKNGHQPFEIEVERRISESIILYTIAEELIPYVYGTQHIVPTSFPDLDTVKGKRFIIQRWFNYRALPFDERPLYSDNVFERLESQHRLFIKYLWQ